jgi:NAD(P)-dependent dehydrogenase (short-subunit alcohol dehydrogenase family)
VKLEGKILAITGGANGIGRELVLQSLARGARVAAVDLQRGGLEALAAVAGAGERLSIHTVDVTDRARVLALPGEVASLHGAVDGIINNAGIIQPFVRIGALEFEAIERVFDVNFYGTLNMVKAFLPVLLERPEAHITNLSSMGGFLPVPGQSIYCATKAAVKLMTEGLYAELLGTNVGVSVVMPGAVNTEITKNSGVHTPTSPDARSVPMAEPARVARAILEGVERNRLYVLPGRDSRLLNLAMRVAPKRTLLLIQGQMKSLLDRDGAVASLAQGPPEAPAIQPHFRNLP